MIRNSTHFEFAQNNFHETISKLKVLFHSLIILVLFIREIQLAAKKKDDSDAYIALGVILFIPFLVFAWRHYSRLKRDFAANASSQRIFDTANLWYPLGVGGGISIVSAYLIFWFAHWQWYFSIVLVPCIGLLCLYLGRQVARWLAATYFGVLVRGELGQLAFMRDANEWASIREEVNRPESASSTVAVRPSAASEEEVKGQNASPNLSPCVETKLMAWEKQHSNEVEQAAASARAAGEEFRSSAGMEELMRQEALATATSECK